MLDRENDQEYEYVRVDALEEQPPYIFIINLLLVVAMRIGAINTQNLAQLKQRCRSSPDKYVKWKRLIWPILMAFASAGLDIPKAASQVRQTLKLGCELVGLAAPIRRHGGCRGAIQDLSFLAGCGNGSRKRGIAQRSIGPQKSSNCDKRVAAIEIVEQDVVAEAFDL